MSLTQQKEDDQKVHIPSTRDLAIRMSNRQYSLLRHLNGAAATADELSHFNQGTVGSGKRRGWLTETARRDGVKLTYEGKEALRQFEHGDFMRNVARMSFSKFLSLDVYDEAAQAEDRRKAKEEKKKAAKKAAPGRRRAESATNLHVLKARARVA